MDQSVQHVLFFRLFNDVFIMQTKYLFEKSIILRYRIDDSLLLRTRITIFRHFILKDKYSANSECVLHNHHIRNELTVKKNICIKAMIEFLFGCHARRFDSCTYQQ